MSLSPGDPNSYSRPDLAVVTHIDLHLRVDFDKKVLVGSVILDVKKSGDTNEVILDNRGLTISTVLNVADGSPLEFVKGESVTYGSKLSIKLPQVQSPNNTYKIEIQYATSPSASGLQWLEPEQTAGGKYPYMFSQCQAIHARSILPCQDTPSVKATYTAEIKAPANLTVLMSALHDGIVESGGDIRIHKFHQPVPIPVYLIALAVGKLVSQRVGPRSHVWAEKELIEQSAFEFSETETMLRTAEDICGPYVWEIYDLLILPPSFPFGGMENPCLTFVTPTLLAGDRSLADVVAHEIAHSWTGNLVTNANFEHFWLNEGFTMFVQRKIQGRIHGDKFRDFSAIRGLKALRETIAVCGETDLLTYLVPNLIGMDPDDAFSTVPYEKGHTFVYYIEQLLGGPEVFEPFLKSYLNTYKYKSIVTLTWKGYLYDYFKDKVDVLNSIDWDTWLYRPGMPPVIPAYDTTLTQVCRELADRWLHWDENTTSPFNMSDITKLSSNQKIEFLAELLLANETLSQKKLEVMNQVYKFDPMKNSEIRFQWIRLSLKGRWRAKVSLALTFVTEQGRMKFIRPIYRDLYAWEEVRQQAIDTFLANKHKMMYVSAHAVAEDLCLNSDV